MKPLPCHMSLWWCQHSSMAVWGLNMRKYIEAKSIVETISGVAWAWTLPLVPITHLWQMSLSWQMFASWPRLLCWNKWPPVTHQRDNIGHWKPQKRMWERVLPLTQEKKKHLLPMARMLSAEFIEFWWLEIFFNDMTLRRFLILCLQIVWQKQTVGKEIGTSVPCQRI